MKQEIREGIISSTLLQNSIASHGIKRLFLVSGKSISYLPFAGKIYSLPMLTDSFDDFTPNPSYESILKGVEKFQASNCDGILAIGGGSALDVAKCIKLFSGMDPKKSYLEQSLIDSKIPLLVIPTTAGTGSESTHFAVIYKDNVKLSVTHPSLFPNVVFLDSTVLDSLPLYQKKVTMLDAICQSIESWWSLASSPLSIHYARQALKLLFTYGSTYLQGNTDSAKYILRGSNLAGQAINLTATTAPHAMSYQLTTLFGLPHGHAVALSLPGVWRYMYHHVDKTHDPRGSEYLLQVFNEIATTMGQTTVDQAIAYFESFLKELDIKRPPINEHQLDQLVASVNIQRLKNTPIMLSNEVLYALYAGEGKSL
ncbi:MAG: phosphonoacetaldehyde reductase [Clostridiales bacterium]|nr:phosphonoacetaldehyde reductase [Clostridiales bacterium]